jgi:beta-glucosidase
VLACAKHVVGDGGTTNGVDQGNTVVDEATLRKIHLAPYLPALKAGAGSVMVSYSSWNGAKMHGNQQLITGVLKGELGFKGFVVSDWAAIDQLTRDYKSCVATSINAGVDMVMVPNGPGQRNSYVDFINKLTELVNEGVVPMTRIDDAVRRILRAKFEAGAFEAKAVDPELSAALGSPAHRDVARECVRESLVLLKNETGALPLSKKAKHILVVGKGADDLGRQCGGWTISWQGTLGNVTPGGTTLLAAIRKSAGPETKISYSPDGENLEPADVVVVVVGEKPYAETAGDRKDLHLATEDVALIKKVKQAGIPLVTVLFSGRPLILGDALDASNAFVAAWLPGTEGLGIADVLFGSNNFVGKLPRSWPSEPNGATAQAAFAFGYGLQYAAPR